MENVTEYLASFGDRTPAALKRECARIANELSATGEKNPRAATA
jgi:hypothetical protein